ncbi:hypothetical protein [uncultured Megasphaera sp.]|uniref:hypothetical protein n=1 Tax=uncultured Megasphaera sp. TaxID=165188 RepID=UPI00261E6B3A|nr:hypothetical protein [uncultured Megasphaera sp.]
MAGFDKAFMFGHATYDGVQGITMELWRGISSRMWFEPATGFKKKCIKVRSMVPSGPDDPDMVLDAAMAFCPWAFASVPEYQSMYNRMETELLLDFNLHRGIPEEWARVRELVRPIFNKMTIYHADIKPLQGVTGWCQ